MVSMAVTMMVVILAKQARQANEVHDKAQNRDQNRLIEADRDRALEAQKAFPADQKSDQRKYDRAGECREIAHLAGSEGEAPVARMSPREAVGKRSDQQGRRMGGHMPAIGDQSHRSENGAGDDLRHHHRRRQANHEPGALLVSGMVRAKEHMVVRDGPVDRSAHLRRLSHDFDQFGCSAKSGSHPPTSTTWLRRSSCRSGWSLAWDAERAHDAAPGLIVTSWVEGR